MPTRRQAIIWTSDVSLLIHIYATRLQWVKHHSFHRNNNQIYTYDLTLGVLKHNITKHHKGQQCRQFLVGTLPWLDVFKGFAAISRFHQTSIGIPIIKTRRSWDGFIFIMWISITAVAVFIFIRSPDCCAMLVLLSHFNCNSITNITVRLRQIWWHRV